MRTIAAGLLVLLTIPAAAAAQEAAVRNTGDKRFSLHVSAGPTMIDSGNALSAGISLTPTPRLTFTLSAQRDHLNYRSDRFSTFRGGTIATVAGEARFNIAPGQRVSPFVLGGMGVGVARPNVAGPYDETVTNSAQTAFAGGGLEIPISSSLSIVSDVRFMFVAERDDVAAMIPVRFGVAWRF
jgi:hypothetical protein